MRRAELAEMSRAERALAQAETVDEVKHIYDLAEAYRTYASGRDEQNRAATIKLQAAAKGGAMLEADPELGRGKTDRLSVLMPGMNRPAAQQMSSRWQKIAGIDTEGHLDGYLTKTAEKMGRGDDVEVSMAGLFHYAKTGTVVDTTMSSTTFECYTPAVYVDAARLVLGGIDLDPASSDEANETVGAETFYTEDDDGLEQRWFGRVWLNPPYGRGLTSAFVIKLIDEFDLGHLEAAIVLLNAYGFDAAWFQPLFDHVLCFTDHRIPFYGGGPTFGSLFVYMGQDRSGFREEFRQFGAVMCRAET